MRVGALVADAAAKGAGADCALIIEVDHDGALPLERWWEALEAHGALDVVAGALDPVGAALSATFSNPADIVLTAQDSVDPQRVCDALAPPISDALGSAYSGVSGSTYGSDVWIQDEFEFATTSSPGIYQDFIIDSIRDRGHARRRARRRAPCTISGQRCPPPCASYSCAPPSRSSRAR